MPGPGDRGGKKERPQDAKGTLRRIVRYLPAYRGFDSRQFFSYGKQIPVDVAPCYIQRECCYFNRSVHRLLLFG